jgi:hypothetical protein
MDNTINEDEIRSINHERLKVCCVLYPDSALRNMVDLISFIFIFVISLYIPFVFTFDVSSFTDDLKYFELVIDLWFLLEIVLNFFTGFYIKGVVVLEKREIAKNYLKSWFAIDLISSFPYSILYFADVNSNLMIA